MSTDELMKRLRAVYPKRDGGHGWGVVPRLIEKAVANGADVERIEQGTKNYAVHCRKKGMVGTEFVQQARTFYGQGQWWEEWADMDMRTPAEKAAETAKAAVVQRAAHVGFRAQKEGEPDYRYEQELREAERASMPRGEPKRFGVVR